MNKMLKTKKSKLDKIVELIQQGKIVPVIRDLEYIKRTCKLVKEITLKYPLEKKELFLQITLPERGEYIVHIVVKREFSVQHKFYLKKTSIKHVKNYNYHIISMRIPALLRNSKLYVKIYKLP